jgi:hypothetical protein
MTDSSRRPLERLRQRGRGEHLLDAEVRESLIFELRGMAGDRLRMFDAPHEWAALAGFDIVIVDALPTEAEREPMTVYYRWERDPRERGLGQYIGLASAFLASRRIAHTHADVWRFALDMAVPVEVRGMPLERVVRSQPHCPVDVIRDVLRARW